MLTNAYLLAKIGADTAENEQHFAEILPIGRCVADRTRNCRSAGSAPSPGSCSARSLGLEAMIAIPQQGSRAPLAFLNFASMEDIAVCAYISCGRISCHLQIHAGKLAGLFLFCNTSREECFRKRKKNKKEKEEKRRRMFQHFPFNSVGGRPCARGHAVVQKKMKPFFENYPIPSRALVCSARAVRTAGPRPGRTGRLAPAIRRRRATSALPPAKPVGSSSRSARLPALRFCVFFQKTWQKNKSW